MGKIRWSIVKKNLFVLFFFCFLCFLYLQQSDNHHVARLARNHTVHAPGELAHKVKRNIILLSAELRGLDAVQLDTVDLIVAVPGHRILSQDVEGAGAGGLRRTGRLVGHRDSADRTISEVLQRALDRVLTGVLRQGVDKAEAAPGVELLVLIPALGARVAPVGPLSLIPAENIEVLIAGRVLGHNVDREVLPEPLTEREVGARPAREDVALPVRLNELRLRLYRHLGGLIRLSLVLRDKTRGVVDIVLDVAPGGTSGERLVDPSAAERRHFGKERKEEGRKM